MVKAVFLDKNWAGYEEGFDIVDEVCIALSADSSNRDNVKDFALKEDPKAFETGVKVWIVHMPDILIKGFIIDWKLLGYGALHISY